MSENRVRVVRTEQGMTQARLAALTNIAQSDISAIENGRRLPGPGWRQRIAVALGRPEGDLFDAPRERLTA